MPLDRTANLLGALSLVIADRTADAMADAGGRPESAAAALSALLHFLDRPSVDLLRQVLGLTSSGTVRLLDRLEEAGYVRRGPGADGRSASISLTESGRAAAEQVTAARAAVLDGALTALSPEERAVFGRLTGKVLAALIRGPGATRWICRLCDTGTCRGADGGCPVGNAARERYLLWPGASRSPPGSAVSNVDGNLLSLLPQQSPIDAIALAWVARARASARTRVDVAPLSLSPQRYAVSPQRPGVTGGLLRVARMDRLPPGPDAVLPRQTWTGGARRSPPRFRPCPAGVTPAGRGGRL